MQHINTMRDEQVILSNDQGEAVLWIENGYLNDYNDRTEIGNIQDADQMLLDWLNAMDPTGSDIDPDDCSLPIIFNSKWEFEEEEEILEAECEICKKFFPLISGYETKCETCQNPEAFDIIENDPDLEAEIVAASDAAYDDDAYMIVGKIDGLWRHANEEDRGRIASMSDPTYRVGSSGIEEE